METKTFNCRFITPAFLGGANPNGTPELRPPSIKGALRFWWRAQAGITDIQLLNERESLIFGGLEGDAKAQKSSFSIQVVHEEFDHSKELPKSNTITKVKGRDIKVNIFEYLAYGTYDYVKGKGNVLNRPFIKPNQCFDITFTFQNPKYKYEVIDAFYLLSLFGGIGARNRNGFGRFRVENESSKINWVNILESLKKDSEKKFCSFSENIACFQTNNLFTHVNDAWAEVGKAYKNAREFLDKPHDYTYRSYISSPIIEDKKQTTFLDRHTKPYFMSIVPENGKNRGIILYLPYQFLEDGRQMMLELFNLKKRSFGNSKLSVYELEQQLIKKTITEHQNAFVEANGFFQDELCHVKNTNPLHQIL